jgi:hypothetical protein
MTHLFCSIIFVHLMQFDACICLLSSRQISIRRKSHLVINSTSNSLAKSLNMRLGWTQRALPAILCVSLYSHLFVLIRNEAETRFICFILERLLLHHTFHVRAFTGFQWMKQFCELYFYDIQLLINLLFYLYICQTRIFNL